MNAIRSKIILSWLLCLAWIVLTCCRQFLLAWCVFGVVLLLRYTKPKIPTPKIPQLPPQRVGYFLGFGTITFLVLTLIGEYHPFPQSVVDVGEILIWVSLWPLLFYATYLDYKAYKAAGGSDPVR